MKVPLTGLLPEDLTNLINPWGEKKYRAMQIFSWIQDKLATSFDEMTDLSLHVRDLLKEYTCITWLEIAGRSDSPDFTTTKYLFKLPDETFIESVYMEEGARKTICVSSQVGCPLYCTFCATGRMGLFRNLDSGEIVEQVLAIQRDRKIKVSNIVFMGMGEPFLNYENTIKAANILIHPKGQAVASRRITISTVGIIPAIKRFTEEKHKFSLAISLNAVENDSRSALMPINKKHPLENLLDAAREYAYIARKPLTFEYVLIEGKNDSLEDARRFLSCIKGIRCKINLIPFNNIGDLHHRPSEEVIEKFYRFLQNGHRVVILRWSKGDTVNAACGQLYTSLTKRKEIAPNDTGLNA